ncbi:hypothetical protein [Algibacter sp. L1A34]|uniref:hypothetical protein n=1 Tax=Algibacter sp. L1A34 TaxID=2686365 RepID=UPI00131DF572|nr:hypothetical protein [Algibacter sp. L1A34]
MKHLIKIPIGFIHIYENFVVSIIDEGETVTKDSNNILEEIASKYFKSRSFVYIAHRLNSYAVDPAVYKKTSLIKNLVGFAVVSKNRVALSNAEIEKLFLNKPFESFTNLDEAINWSNMIVSNNNLNTLDR